MTAYHSKAAQEAFDNLVDATERMYRAGAQGKPQVRRLAEIEAYRHRDRLNAALADGFAFYLAGGRERCPRCGLAMPKRGRDGGTCQCSPEVPVNPPPATGKGRYGSLKALAAVLLPVLALMGQVRAGR